MLLWSCEAQKLEKIHGTFEVLIADDFEAGTHNYEIFLHANDDGERYQLNTLSFGQSLSRLRTGMSGFVQIDLDAFIRTKTDKRTDELFEESHEEPITVIYDVHSFSLVRSKTGFSFKFDFSSFISNLKSYISY
jgi:hypothetical protein